MPQEAWRWPRGRAGGALGSTNDGDQIEATATVNGRPMWHTDPRATRAEFTTDGRPVVIRHT